MMSWLFPPGTPPEREKTARLIAGFSVTNIVIPAGLILSGLQPLMSLVVGMCLAGGVIVWAVRPRIIVIGVFVAGAMGALWWAYHQSIDYRLEFNMCRGFDVVKGDTRLIVTQYRLGINLVNNGDRDIWARTISSDMSLSKGELLPIKETNLPLRIPPGATAFTLSRTVAFKGEGPSLYGMPEGRVRMVMKYGLTEDSTPKTLIFSGYFLPTTMAEGTHYVEFVPDRDSDYPIDPTVKCWVFDDGAQKRNLH